MNLKALKYAVEVSRSGSFTLAAQRLHIAQSALSMAISRLEKELGVPLFNRTSKHCSVTAEGKRFLENVERSLQGLNSARQEMTDMGHLQVGEVRIGFPPMFGLGLLPEWLHAFHLEYPGVVLTAVEGGGEDVAQKLEDRQIDIALMNSRRVRPHWDSVTVASDNLVLCVREGHPLASKQHIEPANLHDLPMVVLDGRFAQRMMLDEYCNADRIKFRTVVQSNHVSLIIKSAQRGMGATTLFQSNADDESGLVSIPFHPPQQLSFSLCWHANEHLSLANRRFVEFVVARAFNGDGLKYDRSPG